MDELMINLFSLIATQVRDKQELFDNEDKIMQMLLNSGYHIQEADTALMLMQTLVQTQSEQFSTPKITAPVIPVRVMNHEERKRFSFDAFGFVLKLTHLGIISEDIREELLDKALAVCPGCIDIEHLKTLIALTLFAHPLEQEHNALPRLRHIKRTAWN